MDGLDIVVVTNGTDHLLDEEHAKARGVRHVKAQVDNPRMLGFAAHRLFAEARHAYDLFCYSEDDLRIADPGFVDRLRAFQDAFGPKRLLMPNRFEWNPAGPTLKTWIDGDIRPGATAAWRDPLPDEDFLASADARARTRRLPPRDESAQRLLRAVGTAARALDAAEALPRSRLRFHLAARKRRDARDAEDLRDLQGLRPGCRLP